jgi:hypothetical protein
LNVSTTTEVQTTSEQKCTYFQKKYIDCHGVVLQKIYQNMALLIKTMFSAHVYVILGDAILGDVILGDVILGDVILGDVILGQL